ncbi:MAG: preprotein translocase subunit SecE [Inconstantimicrobium porci]|uniref:Protein translocase subunit SecE n=1 Tax=Inconstantimicrobium porci TaxID=2652291 RepID=A0A7X2MWN7_9CLOT|nr:preprotein translocase subunit SecE [Inconstantimicrobium porci]MDD6769975.1 preprotein translocase subunit SecE [Inconstantimicrobium porci]MDY5911745.1 preprotein translocase subunit SecE [Inconstantimicrobium porci]MSR90471.1 preprotein translocase subunit SecE [Inconstantimicrobium porci]
MAVNGKVKQKVSGKKKTNFFREVKAEAKRITWPSKEDTKKAFWAVLGFTIISMILICVMDYGFSNLFDVILKLKK